MTTPIRPDSSHVAHTLRRTFQVDRLTVEVYDTADAVAFAASQRAYKVLQKMVDHQGRAAAVFATGRSQKQCLHYLTQTQDDRQTKFWSAVTGFHLDEYLSLPATHPASFRHYLRSHLTSQVQLAAFHEIEGDCLLPRAHCEAYEASLRQQPIDLGFLGIGNNGHLAFNDPDVADFADPHWVKLVRLDEKNRQQQLNSTVFNSLDAVPHYAFTLTLSAIAEFSRILCLAFGEGKATIVRRMVVGPVEPRCPATLLRKLPHATLLLDSEAAAKL